MGCCISEAERSPKWGSFVVSPRRASKRTPWVSRIVILSSRVFQGREIVGG